MVKHWILENKKLVISIAIVIAFAVILLIASKAGSKDADPYSSIKESYDVEEEGSQIQLILAGYYNAYANNDIAALEAIATPISDIEKSYIEFMAGHVSEYHIEEVYSKQGMEDDSFLVSAYMLIDFNELEILAPGLDFFYIKTNENGDLYIDNVYSAFNQKYREMELDPEIEALIVEFSRQEDVMALSSRAADEFDSIYQSDAAFKEFFDNTFATALSEWLAQYKEQLAAAEAAAQAEAEAAAQAEAEAAAQAEAEAQAAAQAAAEEANATKVVALDKVNVRETPSETGNKLGQVEKGQTLTKYADDGEWSKIDFNGTRAYIKSSFLGAADSNSNNAQTTESSTPAAGGFKAGATVKVSDILNIREKMDSNSTKIGVVMNDGTVKVVEDSDPSGWTKIDHNGKVGYIRTDLLK